VIKKTTLKEGMYSLGSGISDHTVTIQSSTLKPGLYRIKIKTKDKWNNEGESEVKELQLTTTTSESTQEVRQPRIFLSGQSKPNKGLREPAWKKLY